MIFIKRGDKPAFSSTVITTSAVQITVLHVTVPDFVDLFEVLGSLERKFPAHILRRLKKRVYELVLTNDPAGKLYVDDIENKPPDSVDVVLGVGIRKDIGSQGHVSFTRMDICMDVLNGGDIDARKLLDKTIPNLSGLISIIKYMIQAEYLYKDGTLTGKDILGERVKLRYENNLTDSLPSGSIRQRSLTLAQAFPTFDQLATNNDAYHTLIAIGCLKPQNIDSENLRKYLLQHVEQANKNSNFRSTWAKAVCLYDRLIHLDHPW